MESISAFFNSATILAALAVMVIQQIMTFKAIPGRFANRYPVPTLIVLSTVASIIATIVSKVPTPHDFYGWVLLIASIGLTAAITYNHTIKNWAQLRAMEGEG